MVYNERLQQRQVVTPAEVPTIFKQRREPYPLEGHVRKEEVGSYTIFITDTCPPQIEEQLNQLKTQEDVEALRRTFYQIGQPSRRSVFTTKQIQVPGESFSIFKRKQMKPNDPDYPGLPIEKFTTDVFHEMQTAYALDQVVAQYRAQLPQTITYKDGQEYALRYQVQMPWGGTYQQRK